MELISNDLSRFGQDISDYQNARQELDKSFDVLIAHMRDLSTMWEGDARDQLVVTFAEDSAKVQEMLDSLKEIHRELQFANTEYTQCESKITGIIDNIPV